MKTYDTIVVGGGIVGLAIARELLSRDRKQRIAIFEKEPELGRHASGRNSGVLHSGIYYPPASLKGRLCTEGARLMREYCERPKSLFVARGERSLHILNAVSPGFTTAFSFARFALDFDKVEAA